MKRVLIVIVVIAIFLSCTACNNDNAVDKNMNSDNLSSVVTNSSQSSLSNSKDALIGEVIDISDEEAKQPIGINGEWFYYSSSVDNNDDTADNTVYKYNIVTKEKAKIGTIENCTFATATYAFLDNGKIFRSQAVAGGKGDTNLHLMIDTNENTIKILRQSECFPPLVDTYAISGTQYLEYQPESFGSEGGYRYHVRVGNSDGEITEIITKERSGTEGTTIISVTTYDGVVYTLESVDGEYNICSYDLTGKELSREKSDVLTNFANIPDELTGMQDPLWSMEVVGGHYFISTLNGRNLVLQKSAEGYEINENLSNPAISCVACHKIGGDASVMLYNHDTQTLIVFNTNNQSKAEYKLGTDDISPYLTTDGERIVYSNTKGQLFVAKIG